MESLAAFYPLLAVLAAYLVGSLSFAVIVSRAMGLHDPRTYGSKNPGATNVLRSGSKAAAIVTLLLDALKGWLPVMLVKWFGARYGLGDGTVAMVGLAAFVGHLFPVFFRFKGGKGVATALGVLVATSMLMTVGVYGFVAGIVKLDGGYLAADRLLFSLFVTGISGGCRFRTRVLHFWWWCGVGHGQKSGAVHCRHVVDVDLAALGEHFPPGQRHRV